MRHLSYRGVPKRILDLLIASVAIVCLAPLLVISAALVGLTLGRPVFFRQQRAGRGGKEFSILKLRTMKNSTDSAGRLLPDSDRLTILGSIMRKLSLDEVPQLWNVIRGEMSLVGPRPLLARYLGRYTATQARRHEVRPGITGWAQIHGRNTVSWERRFELDVWYVDHVSFLLDLWIISCTFAKILRNSDATPEHSGEMPEFLGTFEGKR